MAGTWNGNVVSYGSGGRWYVQLVVTDDGIRPSGMTTAIRISYRIIFENSISDSQNSISGQDGAGAWSANNFAFNGAGNYLIAQRDFEVPIGYGSSPSQRISFSASGMAGTPGSVSSITIDYPIPARAYYAPSSPPTGVDSITPTSARIVVYPSTDGGGTSITRYEAYVLSNNAWPGAGGNIVASAAGGTFVASNLLPGTRYYYTARSQNAAGIYSAWTAMKVFDTLPSALVKTAGVWRNALVYVKYNNAWRLATPYVKINGVWRHS